MMFGMSDELPLNRVTCPHCGLRAWPAYDGTRMSSRGVIVACAMIVLVLTFPFAWIPFVCSRWIEYRCKKCSAHLDYKVSSPANWRRSSIVALACMEFTAFFLIGLAGVLVLESQRRNEEIDFRKRMDEIDRKYPLPSVPPN